MKVVVRRRALSTRVAVVLVAATLLVVVLAWREVRDTNQLACVERARSDLTASGPADVYLDALTEWVQ